MTLVRLEGARRSVAMGEQHPPSVCLHGEVGLGVDLGELRLALGFEEVRRERLFRSRFRPVAAPQSCGVDSWFRAREGQERRGAARG